MSIDDQSPEEANRTRAHWALCALEEFGRLTGQDYFNGTMNVDEDAFLEVGGDLLADLFHLARVNDIDPDAIVSAGYAHFNAEVKEEED